MINQKIGAISIFTGVVAVVLGNSLITTCGSAYADLPGKHPYYLHALSDLRTARWLEEHRPGDAVVSGQKDVAIQQIEAAINDIKQASIDDGKNLNDHPKIDVPKKREGRLRKALQILKKAKSDVAREEDDPTARGLKQKSLKHINDAIKATQGAINDVKHHK